MPTTTFIAAVFVFLAASAPSASLVDGRATWKSCGDGSESITIQDVKLIPDPVVAGHDAAFDVAASVASGQAIPDGSISVDIKYAGAEIAHETVKLCDTTGCPTPGSGPISIKYSKTIPAFIPPGAYTIEVRGRTLKKTPTTCSALHFSFHLSCCVFSFHKFPRCHSLVWMCCFT